MLFVCFGGFGGTATQHLPYSPECIFENGNYIENNRHIKHILERMQTVDVLVRAYERLASLIRL